MEFLLKLKHWQLFLIAWGLPLFLNTVFFSYPELVFQVFPIMIALFTLVNLGWIWAIATDLNHKLPAGAKLNAGRFKIYFSVPLVYILGVSLYMGALRGGTGDATSLGMPGIAAIVILHLLSMVCIFMGLRFAAKTMRSVELGRSAKFGDYAGEFFLMWFSFFGYWVLQPRLNKLIDR